MNSLRDMWFLARADVRMMMREKESLFWVFLMPIVFFYFIGTITGGFGSDQGGARVEHIGVHAPAVADPLGERVLHYLEQGGYQVDRVESEAELEKYRRRLVLPPDITARVAAGETVDVEFRRLEGGVAQSYDSVRVSRAVYTALADAVAVTAAGDELSQDALTAVGEMPRSLTLAVAPAGERQKIPQGYEQTIPGILVMFTMLALLTNGAVLLLIERNQGLLRRLAVTPMRRGAIVAGKWLGKMGLGLIQIVFAMLAGTLMFGMDWGPNLVMVLVVLVAWGAMCASLGLWLGNLVTTEGQAVGIGVLSTNAFAALGGCWWPIEITPDWMQTLQKFLPTGWAMDAMHRLISFQSGPGSVMPHVAALAGGAILFGALASRRFRFE